MYARAVHHDETSPYLEGPIEYRAGDEGYLEPFVGDKPLAPESVIVLTPRLVERELNVGLAGYGPAWEVGLAGDRLRYHNHGWGKSEDFIVPLTAETFRKLFKEVELRNER